MPIQILVTIESLGQYGNGKSYLGVIVQVSSTTLPTSPDERALLCPWLWSNVSFALWRVPAANIKPVVVTASAATQSTSPSTPNADFIERLNDAYDSLTQAANPSAFSWSSVPSESGTPMDSSTPSPVRLYRWPAQLAQLARYPNSVSHQLNLTSFIEFPASEVSNPQDLYVAAPIFTGNKVVYSPDSGAVANYGADKRFTIDYLPTATTSGLTALVQPLPAADCKPPAIRVRDIKNHALDKSDSYVALSSADDSNWQPNLVPLSAELYDLSSRLIGAFRLSFDLNSVAWQSLQSAIASNFNDFRLEVLKALSDVSGRGIKQPPGNKGMSGGSLLEQLMTTWINSFQDPNRRLNLRKFKDDFVSKIGADPNAYTDWFEASTQILALKANEMFNKLPDLSTVKLPDQPRELLRRLSVLEQLHFSFTQNEILSSLVTKQWATFAKRFQASSASPGADVDSWNLFLASAQSSLTNINLRQQFTNGNLGDSWPNIANKLAVGTGVEGRSTLRTALSETLKSNLNAHVANPSISAPLVTCLFVVTESTTSQSWIDTQLAAIVPDAQTSAPGTTPTNPKGIPSRSANSIATRTSNGITLMLDTLSAQDNSDETDLMRETAGFCILARENTKLSWDCLNMAVPCFLPTGKSPVQLGPPTVVPLPLHNQGGLRQALVTYNNQPLMCESPAMEFAQDLASQDSAARLIKYVHPSIAPTPDSSFKIPGLIFGKSYDFLVARVRNSGALPLELAATDDPGKLRLGQTAAQFASHGHTVLYTRTVPVSELRFGPDVSPAVEINTSLKVPAIPPDVQPKALDDPSPISKRTDANEPLILLTSYEDAVGTKSFSFNVYKPTLDILTWDCWVGIDPKYKETRKVVWASYHELARGRESNPGNDVAIDDPAVVGIRVELQLSSTNRQFQDYLWDKVVPPTQPTKDTILNELRSKAMKVAITATEDGTTSTLNKVKRSVSIAPGDLLRLSITPLITTTDSARFAAGILPPATGPAAKYRLGHSYSFLVEAAQKGMPSADKMRDALSVTLRNKPAQPSAQPDQLTFTLTPNSKVPFFSNIRSATLRTQTWRWDGRPFGHAFPFPIPAQPPDPVSDLSLSNELRLWEDQTFATRDREDADLSIMHRVDKLTFNLSVVQDISTELGALYFRSSVEAINRYGSMVPAGSGRTVSSLPPVDQSLKPSPAELWKRTFVPFRWKAVLPKPAIKLILPLTSSLEATAPAASLLVVIQGPWFAIGGLAERLLVELLPAILPDSPNNIIARSQAGPDPIIWRGTQRELDDADYSLAPLLGPVGHTFDDTDASPLWVNSSFVLPPMQEAKNPERSWNFAKVRFRRVLCSQTDCKTIPRPDPLAPSPNTSDYTDPYWVQFLPSSSSFGTYELADDYKPDSKENRVQFDLLHTYLQINDSFISLVDAKNKAIRLHHEDPKTPLYRVLLLTLRIDDLLGRTGQERFLQVCSPFPDQSSWAPPSPQSDPKRLVGRILEIQGLPVGPALDLKHLWDALFPPDTDNFVEQDAKARIVGISPPIYPFTGSSCP